MFNNLKIKFLIEEKQSTKKNLRIQDIANEIGIAKGSLENYRDGISKPTVEMLEKIAIYFQVDMNYFFDTFNKSDITQENVQVTLVNNEFLLDRIEKQAVRINKLEEELKNKDKNNTSYSLQNVPHLTAAEPKTELKKRKKQTIHRPNQYK